MRGCTLRGGSWVNPPNVLHSAVRTGSVTVSLRNYTFGFRLVEDISKRILRGGSWGNEPNFMCSASRNWDTGSLRDSYDGFRLVEMEP